MNIVDLSSHRVREPNLVTSLISISKRTRASLGLRLAPLGLRLGEDDILVALDSEAARSVTQLARLFGVRFETMLASVEKLAERQLVEQLSGQTVRLSSDGASLLPRIANVRNEMILELEATLGTAFLDGLVKDLSKLDGALAETI